MLIKLNEDSRSQLLSKARQGAEYKGDKSKGKNRYERRTKSKISNSVREYNQLDMNKFFKEDILDLYIKVHGETDDYMVGISFSGILELIREETTKNEDLQVDLRLILKMLKRAFNREDKVLVKCSCPDFCLDEQTEIKLLNGQVVNCKQLLDKFESGEELWVYSVDNKGDFHPGKVTDVFISGYQTEMVKVTLDSGESIVTTPNHRYMLRNGEYLSADKLQPGMSLMPLYFSYHDGYEAVKLNSESTTIFRSVYKLVADELLKTEIDEAKIRSNEDTIAIHHSDFNKSNNYPSNLKPMGKNEHWMYHASHVKESGQIEKWLDGGKKYWSTEEARKKQAEICKNVMSEYWSNITPEQRAEIYKNVYTDEWKQKIGEGNKKAWENCSEDMYANRCAKSKEFNNRPEVLKAHSDRMKVTQQQIKDSMTEEEYHNFNSEKSKKAWIEKRSSYESEAFKAARKNAFQYTRTPETEQKRKITKISVVLQKILDNNEIPSPETYSKYRTNGYPGWNKAFSTWEELSSYFKLNHKVVSVETISYNNKHPVYDLTVEKYNNFLVSAGIILHNCYRFSYWASVNDLILGDKENRPSDITNPDDKLGPACKHVILVLSNTSWIVKLASAVNNYIHYIEDHYENAYAEIIYPQLYGREYDKDVQLGLFDKDELDNQDTETANEYGRTRTQFKRGNQSGVQFASEEPESTEDDEQMSLDLT